MVKAMADTDDGIVGFGGKLDPETLIEAYRNGVFPWPIEGLPLPWFCPNPRAILEFSDLHIPRSLQKARKLSNLRFTFDQSFPDVIRRCSKAPRPGQSGTWITPAMVKAYIRLHELGHAHSVEAWDGQRLVGGIYGVDCGGIFAGESMFHTTPNASKLALLFLIEHLRSRASEWMDIQQLTPHMKALGAKEISRDEFLKKLFLAQQKRKKGHPLFEPQA
jgi:leucyl/phenylalanyl-tRNA--protein transferase